MVIASPSIKRITSSGDGMTSSGGYTSHRLLITAGGTSHYQRSLVREESFWPIYPSQEIIGVYREHGEGDGERKMGIARAFPGQWIRGAARAGYFFPSLPQRQCNAITCNTPRSFARCRYNLHFWDVMPQRAWDTETRSLRSSQSEVWYATARRSLSCAYRERLIF